LSQNEDIGFSAVTFFNPFYSNLM